MISLLSSFSSRKDSRYYFVVFPLIFGYYWFICKNYFSFFSSFWKYCFWRSTSRDAYYCALRFYAAHEHGNRRNQFSGSFSTGSLCSKSPCCRNTSDGICALSRDIYQGESIRSIDLLRKK